MDREIAKSYVVATATLTRQRDESLAELIRNDKYFLSHMGGFKLRPANYGPATMAAIDDYIEGLEGFQSNEIAELAVITKSARAKSRLLRLLEDPDQSSYQFWPVWGLITGWGMLDGTVHAALEPLTRRAPEKLQYIAYYLVDIVADRQSCREILFSVAKLPR